MRSIVFEDNSNSPGYCIYTLIIATYCMNKRGFDCALPRAPSLRRFSSFPSSILLSFSSYYPGSLHIFFSFFFLVPRQVSNHLPFPYLSLTSLSDTPLHYEVQLRFACSKLVFVLLDSFALQKIYITMFNACCMLHENMHYISCGANTPGQVQLWQNDVHIHSRSLHRRRVGAHPAH